MLFLRNLLHDTEVQSNELFSKEKEQEQKIQSLEEQLISKVCIFLSLFFKN